MRIGILSDIHCNTDAFKAVLDEFDRQGVEKLIFLGDVIGIGVHAEECAKLLMQQQSKFIGAVSGNHEGYMLYGPPEYVHNNIKEGKTPQDILDIFHWNHSQLSPDSVDFLKNLPTEQTIETDGATIFVTHYPAAERFNYTKYYDKSDLAQCEKLFDGHAAKIYLYGHTHIPNEVYGDNHIFLNPGSVGCPIETNSASAGILDINNGEIKYHRIDVAYDIEKAITEMLEIAKEYPAAHYLIHKFFRKD